MKEKLQLAGNLSLFALAILVLGTVQTSLWFQVFGNFPGPALWVTALVYVALFRPTLEAVAFSYITAFVLSLMTATPDMNLMLNCLALTLTTQFFKQRIYWPGPSYFMMTCGFAAFAYHVFHWGISWVTSSNPLADPVMSEWLIESLLTPLAAPWLFHLFHWFDKMTNREHSADVSAQVT